MYKLTFHKAAEVLSDCTPINATEIVKGTSEFCDCFVELEGYDSAGQSSFIVPCPLLEMILISQIKTRRSLTADRDANRLYVRRY